MAEGKRLLAHLIRCHGCVIKFSVGLIERHEVGLKGMLMFLSGVSSDRHILPGERLAFFFAFEDVCVAR